MIDDNPSIVRCHDQDDKRREDRDPLEVKSERIAGGIEIPERALSLFGPLHDEEQCKSDDKAKHPNPGDGALILQLHKGIDKKHDNADCDDNDFEEINRHDEEVD